MSKFIIALFEQYEQIALKVRPIQVTSIHALRIRELLDYVAELEEKVSSEQLPPEDLFLNEEDVTPDVGGWVPLVV